MPKPKRRPIRKRKSVIHNDLTSLIRLQDNQALKREPRVADSLPMRVKPKRLYTAVQTIALGNITASNVTPAIGSYSFTLSMLTDNASYTTIFDAWRILQVEVQFLPRSQLSTSTSSLLTVIDYDDANVLASIVAFYSYDTLQVSPAGVPTTRVFSPKIAVAAYNSATFSGYTQSSPWIDCASPNVPYYGLKYALNTVSVSPTGPEYDVYATTIYQFRSQRG